MVCRNEGMKYTVLNNDKFFVLNYQYKYTKKLWRKMGEMKIGLKGIQEHGVGNSGNSMVVELQ